MPLTRLVLDQTDHAESSVSGTLVSDCELLDASGFLQAQIPDVLDDLDDVSIVSPASGEFLQYDGSSWINSSGIQEGDVINIIENEIVNIASGVFEQAFFTLPLKGDDDNVAHQTVNGIAVARYVKNTNNFTTWNTISPLGGASGVEFQLSWFPEVSSTADIRWRLSLTQIPSGSDTSSLSTTSFDLDLSDSWVADQLYINTIRISNDVDGLENFSFFFERRGADVQDNYAYNLYAVSYAVRFLT